MNKSFPLRRLGKHQLMRDLSRNGSLRSDENRQGIDALGHLFFRFVFFLNLLSVRFPGYLQHFGAGSCYFNCLCNILELELIIFHRICSILVEFLTFWSWKLPFQQYLQHFLSSNLSFSMEFATFC